MARRPDVVSRQLSTSEQRALAAFLAGRLPAGQLELARARELPAPAPAPAPVAFSAAPASAPRAA